MSSAYVTDTAVDHDRPISWSAVGAGAIAALISHFLFSLLGLGVGALALEPAAQAGAATGAGMAFAWWSISGILSALIGGMVAGRIMGATNRHNPMTHGLLAWGASALIVVAAIIGMIGGGAASLGGPLAGSIAEFALQRELATGSAGAAISPEAQQAAAAMARASEEIASGALFSVLALVVGALAAGLGARLAGAQRRESAGRRPHPPESTTIYGDSGRREDRDIRPH